MPRYGPSRSILVSARALCPVSCLRGITVIRLFNLTPYVLIFTVVASGAIVLAQRLFQTPSANSSGVSRILCLSFGFAVLLLVISKWRWRERHPLRLIDEGQAPLVKAWILSMQIGLVSLVVPVYLSVWGNHNHDIQWYVFGFLDKRWFLSVYWIGIFTLLILPPVLLKLVFSREEGCAPVEEAIDTAPEAPKLLRDKYLKRSWPSSSPSSCMALPGIFKGHLPLTSTCTNRFISVLFRPSIRDICPTSVRLPNNRPELSC